VVSLRHCSEEALQGFGSGDANRDVLRSLGRRVQHDVELLDVTIYVDLNDRGAGSDLSGLAEINARIARAGESDLVTVRENQV
jgi:hypothetical protein